MFLDISKIYVCCTTLQRSFQVINTPNTGIRVKLTVTFDSDIQIIVEEGLRNTKSYFVFKISSQMM